jgi:two-component system, LytTR family, response regulator
MKNSDESILHPLQPPFRMLRTVVVEDNTAEMENVLAFLAQLCPHVQVVGATGEVQEAIALIVAQQPDLLITDVQITGGDCYHLLEKLRHKNQLNGLSIIFMTGYQDFNNATQAFKYAAVDFLVKPFSAKELQAAVEKVAKQHEPVQNLDQLNLLIDFLGAAHPQNDRLAVTLLGGKLQMVELSDVLFLEAKGNMSLFHFKDQPQPIVANRNLGQYVDILCNDHRFFSVSNSLLINLNYLLIYDHSEQAIRIKYHAQPLYASRQGGQRLKQYLSDNQSHSKPKNERLMAFFKRWLGGE